MYEIIDIDGTLTTSGDTPRAELVQYVKEDTAQEGVKFIIVSARPVARLEETKAWLAENDIPYDQIHLNDFDGAGKGPNVGLAFKEAKFKALIEQYGIASGSNPDGIDYVIDNDPEVIAIAKSLGLDAYTPQQHLQDEGHPEIGGTEAEGSDKPDANGATPPMRSAGKELETRATAIGDFTVTETSDGQRTFTGYAALFDSPSAGLPFREVIKAGAFKRSLTRATAGQKIVSFLFGHDETRALATTASGRLRLTEDAKGLRVEAKLDPADPDAAKVISMLTHESAAAGMSFGFTVPKGGDAWSGEERTLSEVNLIEASILSPGQRAAYPATTGLAAVRKIAAPRIGVDADRLISTLESVKAGKELSDDEVEVLDTVRSRLAPKRMATDPTIAAAKLLLAKMEDETV